MELPALILILVAGLFVLSFVIFGFRYFPSWIEAWSSGVTGMHPFRLLAIDLRGVDAKTIVKAMIRATQAGIDIDLDELEAHYLAGGNVTRLTSALIEAEKADIDLDFQKGAAIDLAGRDVFDAVQISVNPKVIDCPHPNTGKETVEAIAQDGIQLKAKARVTVRADINKLIGGATEETIVARVGEGIVTTIGSAASHTEVLENPDSITKKVLEQGLDAGTAFHILSIDIADIDVGDNIGAILQSDQAEADKKVAKAKAEERRAMARAEEQEMQAKVKEEEANYVLAEANKYLSLAKAFADGELPPGPGGDNGGSLPPDNGDAPVGSGRSMTSGQVGGASETSTSTQSSQSHSGSKGGGVATAQETSSTSEQSQTTSKPDSSETTSQTEQPDQADQLKQWFKDNPSSLMTFDENENKTIETEEFETAVETILNWEQKVDSSGEDWFYEEDGKKQGPVSWDEISNLGNEDSSILINYSSSKYWVPFQALQIVRSN